MAEDQERASFEERLARARETERRRRGTAERTDGGLGTGMRMSLELVAGVVAGALVGWGLDGWFGTAPWLLIAFTLLGLGAGFRNLMRAAADLDRRARGRGEKDVKTRGSERKAPDGGE